MQLPGKRKHLSCFFLFSLFAIQRTSVSSEQRHSRELLLALPKQ